MAYLDNNGVLYLWGKVKSYVSTVISGFYTKPSGGIPDSDIASAATWNAKGTYSKPAGGIPDSDIASAATWNAKGTYTKPSGGIPASDLAAGVIPTVPQMATQANMSDWATGKTVDAGVLATNFDNAISMLQAKANLSDVYTKTEIDNKLGGVYVYKGSVPTVSGLPSSGVESGWVYNVESSGMNYAWNGMEWDALGETFTITAITNAEIDTICT